MDPDPRVQLEYRSPPPPRDPATVWPQRRRAIWHAARFICIAWVCGVAFAVNFVATRPLPVWLVFIAVAIGPVLLVLMLIPPMVFGEREHRRVAGLCPTCGYSLRGNESGVCPECGTRVPSSPGNSLRDRASIDT
jgi:hypothetical protein